MPYCENCGEHVTKQFQRVFFGAGELVEGCPSCANMTKMRGGVQHR